MNADKPLGGKAYGSIPHLPGSRLGPGDHHCHEGQSVICCEKARDKRDRIIVTEKLDGSNVSVAKIDGQIVPLIRAGYRAETSPREQHRVFADWVHSRDWSMLPDGVRIAGEWMMVAHGTLYEVSFPLIAFDAMEGGRRWPHNIARELFASLGLPAPYVISDGPPMSIDAALDALGVTGFHGATEQIEGAVWRVERNGVFDFMAKYVRPDKQDGKYFPQISGRDEVVMWQPHTTS